MQFSNGGIVSRQVYPAMNQAVADEVVGAALDGGTGWFDTAEMYGRGHSERLLAHALRARGSARGRGDRDQVNPGAADGGKHHQDIRQAGVGAFRVPGVAAPDSPAAGELSSLSAQLSAMASLLSDGKIRAVGVSNFSAAQMEKARAMLAARGIALASSQVQISLLHRSAEHDGCWRRRGG